MPRGKRERPQCRADIIAHGLRPAFRYDTPTGIKVRVLRKGEEWDGVFAKLPGSDEPLALTDGVRLQLQLMLDEGFFESAELKG